MIYSKKVRALLDAKDFAGARALMAPAKPRTPIASSKTRIRSINPEATKKRRARYAKALSSKHWKALRTQVFEEQGGLCVCGQEPMTVLDHINSYMRLGHELREDVRGLGPICNARETVAHRANWAGDRRGKK